MTILKTLALWAGLILFFILLIPSMILDRSPLYPEDK